MKLADLIVTEQVLNGLAVPNKHSLLHELSKRAGEALRLDPGTLFNAIVARETLGSTGVGMGTAIPHARLAEVRTPYVLFARLTRGIDFESIDDGAPVDLVFFILLPLNSDKEDLVLLALNQKKVDEAIDRYLAAPYTQHNPIVSRSVV